MNGMQLDDIRRMEEEMADRTLQMLTSPWALLAMAAAASAAVTALMMHFMS
ncbi:MAG: hypothetical protein IPJ65_34475 [Archangiaceae bacterium]|nr:hypothetical protein [Archangiaceae bacterium]